jgi:hypothetical protein
MPYWVLSTAIENVHYPAKTIHTVRVRMAQQQSQTLPRDDIVARSERSLNSGSGGIGGMACKHDCGLRQLSLPKLMGSVEF